MKAVLFVALALIGLAAANNILYTRSGAPNGWLMGPRADSSESVHFTIALKQRNLDMLEQLFWQVSDPQHEDYQKFLSISEINAIVSPSKQHHDKVVNWLVKSGVSERHIKSFGDALDVTTTVKVAEKLFSTFFHTYTHESGEKVVKQYGSYSVPKSVSKYIDMITGISSFPIPHLRVQRASNDNAGVVAQTLTSLYKIRSQTAGSALNTSVGVIEFQGQNFSPSDLFAYGKALGLPLQTVSAAHTVGPNDPSNPQTEAVLDIDMTASVNLEASQWFWLENGNGWLYQYATHFASTPDVPQVVSISYGWYESDQCTISPTECQALGVDSNGYVNRVNTEFQKIGLRGVSILVSSGDSGANGRTDPDCSIPQLRAAFPASSPYVTAVGATQLNNPQFNLPSQPAACTNAGYQCASGGQEVAVSFDVAGFASGGGFSNIFAQPSYQRAAVNAYLKSGVALPPSSYFNATSRGFPDVAAIGHNNLINQQGQYIAVGGTSASSPIFASVVALLNQAQIQKTGQPLGFLNPWLYQMYAANPKAFNDVTVGDNKCTEQGCNANCKGFMAYAGWDPVTGLGTPNFPEMLNYVKNN